MDKLLINLNLLEDTLGLSCVENHSIAMMRYFGIDYEPIFVDSYVKVKETIEYFYKDKIQYAYYGGIERVIQTSKKLKIFGLENLKLDIDEACLEIEKNIKINIPVLISVDGTKLPREGAILPWRKDHYILIINSNRNSYRAMDDIPKRIFDISKDNLKDAFGGNILIPEKLQGFNQEYYLKVCLNKLSEIVDINDIKDNKAAISELIPQNPEELVLFRDAIGVLRISRRRLTSWLMWVDKRLNMGRLDDVISKIIETINVLDKIYSVAEIYRLRGKMDNYNLQKLLNEILTSEESFLSNLKGAIIRQYY